MKTNNSKVQKKDAKKAVKKELEKSLREKFLEVVKHLGHDAERIGKDIEIASKFVAKKLSKKFKDVKSVVENKIDEATSSKEPVAKKVEAVKKSAVKGTKSAGKVVQKAVAKA